MYHVIYNGKKSIEAGIFVKQRPSVPAPECEYEEIVIPGRDGVLLSSIKRYLPLPIPVEMNFMAPKNAWGEAYRKAKKWLKDGGTLKMSDDYDVFYKVYYVRIEDSERTSRRIGSFTAVFVCDPYTYLASGAAMYEPEDCAYNSHEVAHPLYHVEGGSFNLEVNGNHFYGSGETYIDTDKQIAYNAEKEIINSSTLGDYDGLYLQEGNNNISITGGTLKIQPNWRMI